MTWQVFSRPEAANDVIKIADWYDSRDYGPFLCFCAFLWLKNLHG